MKSWGTSFVTSAGMHSLMVLGAFWSWKMASPSLPLAAIEVTLGEFMVQSGIARERRRRSESTPDTQRASAVDLGIEKKKKVKTRNIQAANENPVSGSVGQGGDAAVSQGQAFSEWDRYRARARQRLHEALLYPRASKNLGETGQVKVRLTVQRDGTISHVQIAEPSAFDRLNDAALETVKRVARLDPLPEAFESSQWEAFVPIDFALR